jgi:hypothetical protein
VKNKRRRADVRYLVHIQYYAAILSGIAVVFYSTYFEDKHYYSVGCRSPPSRSIRNQKIERGKSKMKIAWKFLTDSDIECLIREYALTETELKILQLRRNGVSAEAIPFKINYQRTQAFVLTSRLAKKIVQMRQERQ